MNDGSIYKNKGIKFTANSFRLREVKILSNVLSKNYNLKTSIVERGVKNEYNIYIPKSSLETLRGIPVKNLICTNLCWIKYIYNILNIRG